MLQKFVVVALLAVILTVGWQIAQHLQTVRHPQAGNRNEDPSNAQAAFDAETQDEADPGGRISREEVLQYGWKLAYAEAVDTARAADKPLMVVFRCAP